MTAKCRAISSGTASGSLNAAAWSGLLAYEGSEQEVRSMTSILS